MIRIELDAYEKKDLITYLNYAKSHYLMKPSYPHEWNDSQYNVERIDHLIDCINGKVKRGGIYSSSFETIEKEPTTKEKRQIKNNILYDKQKMKRRAKALQELEQKKKKERDLIKEFESIWKD